MPNEVRGPILATWGIRGSKAALRDSDDKVQAVVHDALIAGDIDHGVFEEGLGANTVVTWVPLADWWTFWRGGKLTKAAIQKALVSGYDLGLFDAKWFFDTIDSKGGKLKGTDVIAEGLSKEDLTDWIKKIHASGDGSPRGILNAVGWEKIVAKTTNDVLIAVLDAMVQKVNLVRPVEKPAEPKADDKAKVEEKEKEKEKSHVASLEETKPGKEERPKVSEPPPNDMDWADQPQQQQSKTAPPGGMSEVENEPTVSQRGDQIPDSTMSLGEDAMIVVVDDDDMGTTDMAPVAHQPHDPPTARKLQAARNQQDEAEDTDVRDERAVKGGGTNRPAPPRASQRPTRT
jgi:hypothetical protein